MFESADRQAFRRLTELALIFYLQYLQEEGPVENSNAVEATLIDESTVAAVVLGGAGAGAAHDATDEFHDASEALGRDGTDEEEEIESEEDREYWIGGSEPDESESDFDEDYSPEEITDDDVDEEVVYNHLLNLTSRQMHGQRLERMPLISDYHPPPLVHDLADELTLRTAALGPRTQSSPFYGATGPVTSVLSPPRMMMLRETTLGGASQLSTHFSSHLRLPTKPTGIAARMHSRGYIGRFTDDGEVFVAAFQNERRIRMYDVGNWWWLTKDVHARNLRWTVTDTALSSDQRYLLYSSITPVVNLVNVERGPGGTGARESIANVTDVHEALDFCSDEARGNAIWSLSWSADNKEIIAGTADASLYIYDLAEGKTVVRVRAHSDDVNAVAYADSSGNVIFTGSDDHDVKVWDRRTLGTRRATPVGVFIGHTEGVAHLDSKGDGRYLISNGKDQAVKLWDTRSMRSTKEASELARDRSWVPSFQWDYRWMRYPASGRVVSHPHDGAIATYRGHSVLATLIRAYWSPGATTGQRYIYAGSADGGVYIWDVITQEVVSVLRYHTEVVRDCSWHPFLPLLASVAFDGTVCTWEPDVPGDEGEEQRSSARDGKGKQRKGASGRLPDPGGDQLRDWL